MECVAESRDHAGEVVSAIEAVIEFGEVSWHVLGADRTVGAVDRGFDIAECGVDPFEGGVADRSRTTARQDRLMLASSIGHAMKTGQPVADHRAGRVEAVQRKSRNRLAGESRDAAQFQPDRLAVVGGFDRRDKRRLPGCAASALAAQTLTTQDRIFDFHASFQALTPVALHHGLLEFMLEHPPRGQAHAKAPAEFDRRYPLFALRQIIHLTEPCAQAIWARQTSSPRSMRSDGGTRCIETTRAS